MESFSYICGADATLRIMLLPAAQLNRCYNLLSPHHLWNAGRKSPRPAAEWHGFCTSTTLVGFLGGGRKKLNTLPHQGITLLRRSNLLLARSLQLVFRSVRHSFSAPSRRELLRPWRTAAGAFDIPLPRFLSRLRRPPVCISSTAHLHAPGRLPPVARASSDSTAARSRSNTQMPLVRKVPCRPLLAPHNAPQGAFHHAPSKHQLCPPTEGAESRAREHVGKSGEENPFGGKARQRAFPPTATGALPPPVSARRLP